MTVPTTLRPSVSIRSHPRFRGPPGGVRASVFAVHSGQCIISYHSFSSSGVEPGALEHGTHLACDPSSDCALLHLNIRDLYLAFFDINIHPCLGTGILGDHRSGCFNIALLNQKSGDRGYILPHQEQNLNRALGIQPCASLGRSTYVPMWLY